MSFSRRDGLFLLLATGLVGLYALSGGGGFPLDDSWIHQVYGRNLTLTGQWAFIPGVPSAASTSPLYTVLLAIGYALRLPYMLWTHAIGAIALGLCGMLVARLADQVIPTSREIEWITGIAVISTWQLIWAGAAGMETPVFAALTLAVILAAWRELERRNYLLVELARRAALRRGAAFGILGALSMLARPEGVMLTGIAGVAVVIALLLDKRPIDRVEYSPFHILLPWSIGAALGFSLMISPYLLLNLSLTGGLLPNTAAAKIAQHTPLLAYPYITRFGQMLLPLLVGGQVLLIPGIITFVIEAVRKNERRQVLLYLLPVLWVIAQVMLYAARLPAAYQHGRYVLPALPALVFTGVVGTRQLIALSHQSRYGRILVRALTIAAAMLFISFAFGLGRDTYRRDVSIINQEHVTTAHWISENLPETDDNGNPVLAIYDIGAVGYFAPRPLLDIAGLLSPQVIPLINDPAGLWGLMQQEGAQYLMGFPDQIPGYPNHLPMNAPTLCPVYTTEGTAAKAAGGANMTVYRLMWEGDCED
jgi:hypothetical protein